MVSNKVYSDIIDPKYVTDFKSDNRGYLTQIRIDIPQIDDEDKQYTYVEYWDKKNNYWAIWHNYDLSNATLDQLGGPIDYGFISDWRIDFIPIVHIKFSDTGKELGHSCVEHAVSKIDEANRQSTRLHELLFRNNKSTWVVNSNKVDTKTGKFQPAPLLNNGNPELKDNQILYMPGMSDIKSLIPDIRYDSALQILNAMMDEIANDLPEIRYFDVSENTSGKAIRLMLGSAIDRATEAQSNLIAGLERLDEMALTLGSNLNIFSGLGTYENGDFDHQIVVDEMFPLEKDEVAIMINNFTQGGLALATSLKIAGYSDEFIQSALAEKQAQDSQSITNDQTRFNAGAINLGV